MRPTRQRTTSRTARESKSMDTTPSWKGPPPPGGPLQGLLLPGPLPPPLPAPANNQGTNNEFRFNKRIKILDIPMWDRNGKTILEWLDKLNHITYCSYVIFTNLGAIAPLHLTAAAEQWFCALPTHIQHHIQQDWGEFKLVLSTYFMNQQWFNWMKGKVLHTHYCQKGHKSETPSNYYH